MQLDEWISTAASRALELRPREEVTDALVERLRLECIDHFAKLPEPPLYRRSNDPAKQTAEALLGETCELLSRCMALALTEPSAHTRTAQALSEAARAHLEALLRTSQGKLEEAEVAWQNAIEKERRALGSRRLWVRSDESPSPVFDRQAGTSRFDPRPEALIRVKLACPQTHCHHQTDYSFSPRHSTQRFTCPRCHAEFIAFFGTARQMKVEKASRYKRYEFRIEDLGGKLSRLEFDEGSGAEFAIASRDLLAFLYSKDQELRGVLNLSSGRLLWVRKARACFVATAVYGAGAPELAAFRGYRDRVLLQSWMGAALVHGYYRWGPALAALVERGPRLKAAVRWLLERVRRALVRRGYA